MQPLLATRPGAVQLGELFESGLGAALAALERKDDEALHDFRVALRHLQVWVKQLVPQSKQRKRVMRVIKGLMAQSDRGRDAQVMLAWLKAEWPLLDVQQQIGARHWRRKLERAEVRYRIEPNEASIALHRLVRPLAGLSQSAVKIQPFGQAVVQSLEQQSNALIALIADEGAQEQLHQIRLKVKTVRYLLLPFCDGTPACTQAEAVLHQMQMRLGDWHDAVLRQQSLHDILRKSTAKFSAQNGAELPPEMPGLLALMRTSTLIRQRLAARIKRHYLNDGGAPLAGLLHQAIASLATTAP